MSCLRLLAGKIKGVLMCFPAMKPMTLDAALAFSIKAADIETVCIDFRNLTVECSTESWEVFRSLVGHTLNSYMGRPSLKMRICEIQRKLRQAVQSSYRSDSVGDRHCCSGHIKLNKLHQFHFFRPRSSVRSLYSVSLLSPRGWRGWDHSGRSCSTFIFFGNQFLPKVSVFCNATNSLGESQARRFLKNVTIVVPKRPGQNKILLL